MMMMMMICDVASVVCGKANVNKDFALTAQHNNNNNNTKYEFKLRWFLGF
jgi:hypothetical protein